jgi:hypothetical protein
VIEPVPLPPAVARVRLVPKTPVVLEIERVACVARKALFLIVPSLAAA